MAPGTEIDGRKIRVDYSITKRAHTPTPGVYLGRPAGWVILYVKHLNNSILVTMSVVLASLHSHCESTWFV